MAIEKKWSFSVSVSNSVSLGISIGCCHAGGCFPSCLTNVNWEVHPVPIIWGLAAGHMETVATKFAVVDQGMAISQQKEELLWGWKALILRTMFEASPLRDN